MLACNSVFRTKQTRNLFVTSASEPSEVPSRGRRGDRHLPHAVLQTLGPKRAWTMMIGNSGVNCWLALVRSPNTIVYFSSCVEGVRLPYVVLSQTVKSVAVVMGS